MVDPISPHRTSTDPTSPGTPDDLVEVAGALRTRLHDAAVPTLTADAEQVIRQGRGIRTRRTVLATALGVGAVGLGAGVLNQVARGGGPVQAGNPTTEATAEPAPSQPSSTAPVTNPDHLGAVRKAGAQPPGPGQPEDRPGLVYDVHLNDQNGLSATYLVTDAEVKFQFAEHGTKVGSAVTVAIPVLGKVTAVKAPVASRSSVVLVVGGPGLLGPIIPEDRASNTGTTMLSNAQGQFIGSVTAISDGTGNDLPATLTGYLRQRYGKHQVYAVSATGARRELFTTTVDVGIADPALLAQDEVNDRLLIHPSLVTVEQGMPESAIAAPRDGLVGQSHFVIKQSADESGKGRLYGAFIPVEATIDSQRSGFALAQTYRYAIKGEQTQLVLFSAPRETTGVSWTDAAGQTHLTTAI